MSVSLPDGSTISIASAYAASVVMSALTNANPAVATLADVTGLVDDDFLEVTSGWPDLNSRIVQISAPSGSTVTFEGIDSTDSTRFSAGSGTGSVRKISSWQQVSQVLNLTGQGGDQQFVTYSLLESKNQFQVPSVRSPASFQMDVADDSSLAYFATLQAADDDRKPRALKVTLPGGDIIVYNAYITLAPTPTLTKGQVISRKVTASFLALPVRYSAS